MSGEAATAQPGAGWDEAQCTAALAQLERLQQQLDTLRLTIPRVVEPFCSPPTPAMFAAFKAGVSSCQSDIKRFRNEWSSPETRALFEHVKESLKPDADLSDCAQVPQYGWVEREARGQKAARRRNEGAQTMEESQTALTEADVSRIVNEFRTSHPNISFKTENENRELFVTFVSNGSKLRFHILIERKPDGQQPKLDVECVGTTDPFPVITRCIASRPQSNDLKYLLDMIAAYKTVDATTCAKCSKMLDGDLTYPTARRTKQSLEPDGQLRTQWVAVHEGCLD